MVLGKSGVREESISLYSFRFFKLVQELNWGDFPGGPVVQIAFPLQGAGVWTLIFELRSYMPSCEANRSPPPPKKKKLNRYETELIGEFNNTAYMVGGFPGGTCGKEPAWQHRRRKRHRFNPWVGKIPWRKAWQATPAFLSAESHAQRSLAGYSPWGRKELDMTEQACTCTIPYMEETQENWIIHQNGRNSHL